MSAPAWRAQLARIFPDALFDEPMSKHTTFRIGGPADAYVAVRDEEGLAALHRFAREKRLPVFALGWGSNLLVRDGGIRGIVLRLRGEFEKVRFPAPGLVRAGAGVRIPQLVVRCAAKGLAGTEPLVGVPGTVGGALVMNAGTREGEIGDLVREVEVLGEDGLAVERLPRERVRFEYRASSLAGRLVLGATLELKGGDKGDIIRRVKENQLKRLRTQPIHTYNVGSVFKNPPGRFVAQLIEQAGLKGRESGGARVSPMHANFIENHRKARAADVLRLVDLIREDVLRRHGVELELEMKVVGEETSCPA